MAFIFLLLFSLLPLFGLIAPGLPITHDGQDHVARIANFYLSLSEGNLIPRWAGNLNWGYGHPILMFLYPLPSYIASFFHWTGFSFVDSTKLVFGTAFAASILAMYLWLARAYGTKAGFVGAVLYGFAPYRFVDLYVRGALGEHVAFVFPPLICWGLLLLAKKERPLLSSLLIPLGTAGLLMSHNALSLMFLPLILLYVIFLLFFETKDRSFFILHSSFFILLGFLLSAFFWIPAFFEGKYTLRDLLTKGDFANRFVPWQWFFVSPWNYGGGNEFSKEIGLLHWMGIVGSVIVLFKSKVRKLRIGISVVLIVFFTSLFLMTEYAQMVWNNITIMQKFQFPWRFLSISVFVASVLSAISVANLSKKFSIFIICFVVFVSLLSTKSMWMPKDYLVQSESFYSGVYAGTTDTGESSPIWSVRFMEQLPKFPYEIIEGKGRITPISRSSTEHEFLVDAQTKIRVLDNTLYFPGWTMWMDSKPAEVQFQDPQYRGLITFWVPAGEHRIVVSFGDTKLRRLANMLSISGLAAIILYEAFRRASYF